MKDEIRNAICRIEVVEAGAIRSRGTGTLVAENLVLTALHVVADRRVEPPSAHADEIRLTFRTRRGRAEATPFVTGARMCPSLWDGRLDWVLLECDAAPPVRPLALGDLDESGVEYENYGYPDAQPVDGLLHGGIVEHHNAEYLGVPTLQLYCRQAAAGGGEPVSGCSGGPVIVDGALVGIVRAALLTDERQTVAGTLYACPVWALLERTGDLLPLPDPCRGLPGLPRRPLPVHPFRYLTRFTERDAEIFFGRGKELRSLYQLVDSPDSPRVVLLFGQSGSGKSSFLDAGLMPRLRRHYEPRYLRRDPRHSLLDAVIATLSQGATARCESDASLRAAWLAAASRSEDRPVVVIFDQIEEVLTHPSPERVDELGEFIAAVADLFGSLDGAPHGRLILALRKEWYAEVRKHLEQHDLAHGNVFLEGMDRDAIIEVVTGLTATRRLQEHYRLTIEDGLAERIADDLRSDPDSPVAPALSVLLTRMWRETFASEPQSPSFTFELYSALKAEGLLLSDFIDQQLAALAQTCPAEVDCGLALDVLGEHVTALLDTRDRSLDELLLSYRHVGPRLHHLLEHLVDLYLLAKSTDGKPGEAQSTRLAHNTLARHVRRLLEESDRLGQRARRVLESRAREWSNGREGTPLDSWGLELVERGLMGTRAPSPDEARLIAASRALRDRHRRRRRALTFAGMAIGLALIATASWALRQQFDAWEQRKAAEQQRLLTDLFGTTGQVSHLLGTEIGAVSALMRALVATRRSHELFNGEVLAPLQLSLSRAVAGSWESDRMRHGAFIAGLASDAAGSRLASIDVSGRLRFWRVTREAASNEVVEIESDLEVDSGTRPMYTLAMSGNGALIATADADKRVHLWTSTGKHLAELTGHSGHIYALAFNPVSNLVASADDEGDVRLWTPGGQSAGLLRHGARAHGVFALAFSPGGNRLVAGTGSGMLQIWDVATGGPIGKAIRAHAGVVSALVYGSSGDRIVSGGFDGDVHVWTVDGARVGSLNTHNSAIVSLVSRDADQSILSSSIDGGVFISTVSGTTGRGVAEFSMFGPYGSRLLVAGERMVVYGGNSARLVDEAGSQIFPPRRLAFDPEVVTPAGDSGQVATAGWHENTLYWQRLHDSGSSLERRALHARDTSTEKLPVPLSLSREGRVVAREAESATTPMDAWQLAMSLDGQVLAMTEPTGRLRVWRPAEGSAAMLEIETGSMPTALAVSPDGALVAALGVLDSVEAEPALRVWRTSDGRPFELAVPVASPRKLAFSRSGTVLAAASENCVSLWDLAARSAGGVPTDDAGRKLHGEARSAPLTSCRARGSGIFAMALDSSGARVVTGNAQGELVLWQRKGSTPMSSRSLKAHASIVTAVAFRPDDGALISAALDGTVRLWTPEGVPLLDLPRHRGRVSDVAFTPDGLGAASVGSDRKLRISASHWRQLATLACRRLRRHTAYRDHELELARATRETCEQWLPPLRHQPS